MGLLKNIFGKKEEAIKSYSDFWNWFKNNEQSFFKVVKENGNIEKGFFEKLSPKLNELKEGFYYVTGMYNDHTVELVFTAEGDIKNIAFVEELVNSAPKIDGWMFTALKPALDITDVNIKMEGLEFNRGKLWFYANTDKAYPDEIDITVVHQDFNEQNASTITNGTYIFLDNFLGELHFVTTIDNLNVVGKAGNSQELVPIEKLKDYLTWRQKEFVEKYEGLEHTTENDAYGVLEATLESGANLIAALNTDLLKWDAKASHPWILTVEIPYDGSKNNGMPGKEAYEFLDNLENEILAELKDSDGYLNIGRQTSKDLREIYFACRDFRKPSKVLHELEKKYSLRIPITWKIYKDKYWRSFNRFNNHS